MAGAPSENLFLGDLPGNIDDATLVRVFSAYGNIKSHKLLPLSTKGAGNAIISFETVDQAAWIVNNLHGNIPQGLATPITVQFKKEKAAFGGAPPAPAGPGAGQWYQPPAAPPPPAPVPQSWPAPAAQSWGGGKGGGKPAAEPSPNVFIGDLPPNCDDALVTSVFGAYGTIVSHRLVQPGTSGKFAAIVSFSDVPTAQWIVDNLNGNIPQGLTEPIVVRFKTDTKGKGKDGGAPGGFAPALYAAPSAPSYGGPPPAPAPPAPAKGGYQQGGASFAPAGGGGGKGDAGATVFIGDLPMTMDDANLRAIFGAYGNIVSHKLMPPGISGAAALISFSSPDEANWIVANLNENIPQGLTTPIKARFKTPRADKGFGKGPY